MTNDGVLKSERLPTLLDERLFTEVLGKGMYTPEKAIFELLKNAFDGILRRFRRPAEPSFATLARLSFVDRHPLFPQRGAKTLICLDDGEGITPASENRLKGASGPVDLERKGEFGSKKIGKFSFFTLLNNNERGYWIVTATDDGPTVIRYHLTPKGWSEGELLKETIYRDDQKNFGLCPSGSFTMVILPDVIRRIQTVERLIPQLQTMLPHRPSACALGITINGERVPDPELPGMKIEYEDLVGYFERTDDTKSSGIVICDAELGTIAAHAMNMPKFLPHPFSDPRVRGAIFIPDTNDNQNTARDGLNENWLHEPDWARRQRQLFVHFSPTLRELLGDEPRFKNDALGSALKDVVDYFNAAFGKPARSTEPRPDGSKSKKPDSIAKPETEDHPPADKPSGAARVSRKPEIQIQIMGEDGKEESYILMLYRMPLSTHLPAVYAEPNVVNIYSDHPLILALQKTKMRAHLPLFLLRAIIEAIESNKDHHPDDAVDCQIAVNTIMERILNQAGK
jgi:hypothetical protein